MAKPRMLRSNECLRRMCKHECSGATNAGGECASTNVAELRMPLGRMFFERMPAANVQTRKLCCEKICKKP